MKQSIYWVMALAAGLVAANNYYNQPLLVDFAQSFGVTERQAGAVSVAAQAGYALGLLLFIPLGDKVELRKLFALTLAAAVARAAPTVRDMKRDRRSGDRPTDDRGKELTAVGPDAASPPSRQPAADQQPQARSAAKEKSEQTRGAEFRSVQRARRGRRQVLGPRTFDLHVSRP